MNKNIIKIIFVAGVAIALIAIANHLYGSPDNDTVISNVSSVAFPEKYSNEKYKFSFQYPSGLKISEFPSPDGEGDVVLAVDPSSGIGMQVYITAFDEPASALTIERVKSSLPDVTLIDPKEIKVGDTGLGVIFKDGSSTEAKIQEWFVVGGNLYQVTAPVSFENVLKDIINSWKFL